MEPISINLRINGKNKKFVTPNFISGKLFRDAAEIAEDIESTDPERIYTEKQIEFVCTVFGNKFTADDFENGIDARLVTRTIYGTANYVLGNIAEASQILNPDSKDGEEPGEVNLSDAVIDMYNALEEIGYTQNQIDEMDIVYHLRRLARRKEADGKPAGEKEEKRLYIDQVLG